MSVTQIQADYSGITTGLKSRRARLLTKRFTTSTNSTVATRYPTESDKSVPSEPSPEIGLNTSPIATPSRVAVESAHVRSMAAGQKLLTTNRYLEIYSILYLFVSPPKILYFIKKSSLN